MITAEGSCFSVRLSFRTLRAQLCPRGQNNSPVWLVGKLRYWPKKLSVSQSNRSLREPHLGRPPPPRLTIQPTIGSSFCTINAGANSAVAATRQNNRTAPSQWQLGSPEFYA